MASPRRPGALWFLGTLCFLSICLNVFLIQTRKTEETSTAVSQSLQGFTKKGEALVANNLLHDDVVPKPVHPALTACLLIKDDNEILSEWIAYHYHTMEMKALIVAVDPSSVTSPSSILERWKPYLTIEEWHDPNFMPESFMRNGYHIPPEELDGDATKSKWHQGNETSAQVIADKLKILNHRFRQVTFLSHCLRHSKQQGYQYVMHIDTDEYVVVNPFLRKRRRTTAPKTPAQKGCLWEFLTGWNGRQRKSANHPCISMPRLLFGSVEKDATESASNHAANLETMRWKYHTAFNDTERNAQPKVLIDVSKVPVYDEMFSPQPFSIHRPSKALCRRLDQLKFEYANRYPLTVHHYLGTAERYFARNDTRRSMRFYEFKAHVQDGYDDWILPWYEGFRKSMGPDVADQLLFEATP